MSGTPKKHITSNDKNSEELIDCMGNPYLNSGEDIVLTTHRVIVDAVPYDIMLTTERIFLIDNRSSRFEPRIFPLSTVLSVQAGKTPAYEPVITLLFRPLEGGIESQPINLVFSLNPNENRKPERDDWVRSLIKLSVTQHERETVPEISVIPEETGGTGLRPTARHGITPEMVRPLSNVAIRERIPAPVKIIPDEIEAQTDLPATAAVMMHLNEGNPAPEPLLEAPAATISPGCGTPYYTPTPPARVIIPQIIEELLPEKKTSPPTEEVPAQPAGLDPEALFRTIPMAARSITVTEERRLSQHPVAEIIPRPLSDLIVPVIAEHNVVVPEMIKALHTGITEPETPEHPDDAIPDAIADATDVISAIIPEPVPDSVDTTVSEVPESHVAFTIPESVVQESASNPTPGTAFPEEPAAAEEPPVRHPIPPAREIRPLKTTLAYAVILLLFVVLIAAGAVLLFPPGPVQSVSPITPVPTLLLVTTPPPAMVLLTTLPSATTVPPATTWIATPVPSLPASTVTQTGVWVRVTCTSDYFGMLGNAGSMRQVSGTGDNFYKVLRSDRPVQVSVQKKDNSGSLLTVAIYRDGTLISTRSVTSPMGTVDVLIDPITALAPGLSANDVLPAPAATQAGLENY